MTSDNPSVDRVTRVFSLPVGLLARADAVVDDPTTQYRNLSQLVELALRNQLELVSDVSLIESTEVPVGRGTALDMARDRIVKVPAILAPIGSQPFDYGADINGDDMTPLSFLTNRLNPVSLVVRCLANLGPVNVQTAQLSVSEAAREIGMELRRQDATLALPMPERKSTSWPVGADAAKSALKFNSSYLIEEDGTGPLTNLGLARLINNQVVLTQAGFDLAKAPSPLLQEVHDGATIGAIGQSVLKRALMINSRERANLKVFFEAINEYHGDQGKIDQFLAEHHQWSEGLAVSNRAAYVGRLRDLEIVLIEGRGPKARILIADAAKAYVHELLS